MLRKFHDISQKRWSSLKMLKIFVLHFSRTLTLSKLMLAGYYFFLNRNKMFDWQIMIYVLKYSIYIKTSHSMHTVNWMTGYYITPTVEWNDWKWLTQIKFQWQERFTSRITCLMSKQKAFWKCPQAFWKCPQANSIKYCLFIETSRFMCTEYEATHIYRTVTLSWNGWKEFAQ